MKSSNTLWARVLVCCLSLGTAMGSWAGKAAAQADDSGGWFDDPAQAPYEPVDPAPPAEPDYSPPPADFQTPPPPEAPAADGVEDDGPAQQRAMEEFSPRLAAYGRWVDDPWYGRVWVPSRSVVGSEFVPYSTGGHWELTPSDAWLWASDYPFGGITFHYGRWVWASGGVWAWVPGYVYSPAWVEFHVGAGGYIGWAPLSAHYVWRRGVFLSVGIWQPAPVVFCPTRYVFARTLPRYVIRDPVRVRSISAQTRAYRPSRGPNYLRGPSPREAQIPRAALPERRVIAQPRIALQGSAYTRSRVEASRYSDRRSLSTRPETTSRGYSGPARDFSPPSRDFSPPSRDYRSRSYGSRDVRQRDDSQRRAPANGYTAPPTRPAPAMRRPAPARPGGFERGVPPRQQYDRSAPRAVPRERSRVAPMRSERLAQPRAVPRVEGDSRGTRRARRDDSSSDNSKSESRSGRSRERHGGGR